jgi:hypothetical protein
MADGGSQNWLPVLTARAFQKFVWARDYLTQRDLLSSEVEAACVAPHERSMEAEEIWGGDQ